MSKARFKMAYRWFRMVYNGTTIWFSPDHNHPPDLTDEEFDVVDKIMFVRYYWGF